jgi:hypothetical protein
MDAMAARKEDSHHNRIISMRRVHALNTKRIETRDQQQTNECKRRKGIELMADIP